MTMDQWWLGTNQPALGRVVGYGSFSLGRLVPQQWGQ
jgi:hypothetical protein